MFLKANFQPRYCKKIKNYKLRSCVVYRGAEKHELFAKKGGSMAMKVWPPRLCSDKLIYPYSRAVRAPFRIIGKSLNAFLTANKIVSLEYTHTHRSFVARQPVNPFNSTAAAVRTPYGYDYYCCCCCRCYYYTYVSSAIMKASAFRSS